MSFKEADDLYSHLPAQLQKAVDLAKEKGAFPDSQLSLSRNMAFHYIGLLSMMPWLCDTDGLLQISHLSATAATLSLLNMHSHVLKEVFPPSGTMKSVILQPISSQKCVARGALNPICSQLRQTNKDGETDGKATCRYVQVI